MLLALLLAGTAHANDTTVTSIDALRSALAAAQAGDTITLAPGTYAVERTLTLSAAGTPTSPITLRGTGATLVSTTTEALKVTGPHWHLEALTLVGACATDDTCEHALHIVGAADGTWLLDSELVDFNAQIKANGEVVDGVRVFPDDVRIVGNDLHDTRPRQTANPVTKIDVVGGRRWVVEANRIADFEKAGGDTVSYAAFLKGASRDGIFARNLIVCAEQFVGGVRVGLSLGGGGTDPAYCEDGACASEHVGGTLTDNVVAHCNDVGIYLNKATDTLVRANTLFDTAGIDVRFPTSTATVVNNLLDGRIRERDGGVATLGTNLAQADLRARFIAPDALDFTLTDGAGILDAGALQTTAVADFCGSLREGPHDLGAIEYVAARPCDTTVPHPLRAAHEDTGEADTAERDTGVEGDTGGDTASTVTDGADDPPRGAATDAPERECGCAASPTELDNPALVLAGMTLLVGKRRRRRTR